MDRYLNPRVVGACLIGFAMVAGSYVATNFGESRHSPTSGLYAIAADTPLRYPIEVKDSTGDGVEDWRDQFVTAAPIDISPARATSTYTPPSTLTEQVGIRIMEGLIVAQAGGPTKPSQTVVNETVESLGKTATSDKIYDIKDIIINPDTSDLAVKNYGNALALIILNQSTKDLDNELVLLRDFLERKDTSKLADIKRIAEIYQIYRDETLLVPVPQAFVKQHLDLINVYNALHQNIKAMSEAETDPIKPFLRIKRYEDDAVGLALAMKNMYDALATRASAFEASDPALLFIRFSNVING